MDSKIVFNLFYKELKTTFFKDMPDVEEDEAVTAKHIETTYYPHIMKIVQKDASFFSSLITFRSIDISALWNEHEEHREMIWKNMLTCLIASFFHGDFKDKIGSIINVVKSMWNISSSAQDNDEIGKILNDENNEGHFKDILEYLENTRIAKLFMEIIEQPDLTSEIDLNFEKPQELIELLRNPEHPKMKKVISNIRKLIQKKMQHGSLTEQQIIGEIEGIKAKIQGLFGNVFNDMLGGHKATVPSSVLMSNSPEARRQRMLARLQKKQRDKNSH